MLRFSVQNFRSFKETGSRKWEIVIIEEGLSQNGTFYPKETLLASRNLFEGAKICFYEHVNKFDHIPKETRAAVPGGFPKQVAGLISDVKLERLSNGKYGLVGVATIMESQIWLDEYFREAAKLGFENILGFSIDVLGVSKKEIIEGREVELVTEIGQVNEVTVVTHPAAGGRLYRMVASIQQKEKNQMDKVFLALISAFRPLKFTQAIQESDNAKLAAIGKDTLTEMKGEFREDAVMLGKLEMALKAIEMGSPVDAMKAVMEAIAHYKGLTEAEKEKDTGGEERSAKVGGKVIDVTGILKRLDDNEKSTMAAVKAVQESNIRAVLAESKLPDAARQRVKSKLEGRAYTETDVVTAIEDERKYISSLTEGLHPAGISGVVVGQDTTDKLGDAMEGLLKGTDVNKQPRFKSLYEAFSRCNRISPFESGFRDKMWDNFLEGAKGHSRGSRLKEAVTTTQFGELLADRLHKRMVQEYNEEGLEDWRKVVNINPNVADFKTNRAVRVGGYGTNMAAVAENGTYAALTSPTDEEATYSVTKRGGLETITMEAFKNDDINRLSLIPKRLGRGCKNTLYQFVFDFFRSNPTIYDTVAYFDAAHGNTSTTALSYTQFNTVLIAMADQAAYNEANFFPNNKPKYIIVPNELWLTAWEISRSMQSFSGARTETVDNAFKELGLEPIMVQYWTDATDYVVLADPAKYPTIEVAFLDGNEEPELLQEAQNSGSDFTNDAVRYKIRHIYGGAVVDYRSAYKGIVA